MKFRLIVCALGVLTMAPLFAAEEKATAETPAAQLFKDGKGMFNRRLGMFVHWGIYSVDGYHEQQQWRLNMPRAEYVKRVAGFTAEKFDADVLVAAAESAGAEYIVFTTKHHDGFCMWDTKQTDFKVTKSPCGRDLLKEISEACRRRGMKLGLYYSNPDWNNPHAYIKELKDDHQIEPEKGDVPDLEKYIAYVKAQITELMTNYGDICCLFWDIPTHVDRPEMNALVRKLQPGILIDNRGWGEGGDYTTPERDYSADTKAAFAGRVEACNSVGKQSWGYRIDEDYHTIGYLTRSIDRYLARGGNFLLNVGPKADGTLTPQATRLLAEVGRWYAKTKESYRDVETVAKFVQDPNCIVTRRGETLYFHFCKGLDETGVDLKPLADDPASVVLLNTGKELPHRVETLPRNYKIGPSLHVWDIPADELANESIVLKATVRPEVRAVRTALEDSVARGDIAGVVSIHSGPDYSEHIDCVGYADIATKRPMTPDTMFALFSCSKSVCGTAIMMLVAEGKLSLDDEVSKYMPEFADVKVEEKGKDGKVRLVPPKRPLTVRDLMAHTTGTRFQPPIVHRDFPLRVGAWWMASVPLKYHPGETFSYNNAGIDAGGAIVEIVSGMPYGKFCEERIFKPLGMKDTTFTPSPEQAARLATCYNADGKPFVEQCEGYARQTVVVEAPHRIVYPAPSAGLYSTPRDFIRYSQMLAHHGTWKGVTLIPRELFDSTFCVKQTAEKIDQPYTVGNWIRGDWFGHSGALKNDQRANIKTGHCRLFFVQVQVPGGDGFERCKDNWNIALDALQGAEGASPCRDFSTKRTAKGGKVLRGR